EAMTAGRGGVLEEAGREGSLGGGLLDGLAVIGKSHPAATRLLQIVEFDRGAVRIQVDGLAGALGGNTDAAEAEQAVAMASAQAGRIPGFAGAAAHVEAAIALERNSRQREARAAIAEAALEEIAEHAGPIVGRGVGIAKMHDVHGGAVTGGEAIEALEEGHQRARPIDDRVGALI